MIPLTCVARATGHPKDRQKLWALMTNRSAGFYAFTHRAPRSYGAVAVFSAVLKIGGGGRFFPEVEQR